MSRKVDRLSCVRFGSARYSVPSRLIGTTVLIEVRENSIQIIEPFTGQIAAGHQLVAPGEVSIADEHYGSSRPGKPRRAPRPRTGDEKQFLALGDPAAAFLAGAAAAGVSTLHRGISQILTQRWNPEEFLRTLIEAEITARDESNARTRMRSAAFPVAKTLAEFDVTASSIPQPTFDYPASLECIRAAENTCLTGPAGTGKSHTLVALGVAAVEAGHRVRYFTAADLVETLYRALADNSVGKTIENLLRNVLIICDELGFAPLDDTGAQLLFRFVAAAYERRSPGLGSHWIAAEVLAMSVEAADVAEVRITGA